MIIYHGSELIVEKPELSKGKPHNDFGRGFYCTESLDLAKEWACARNRDGFANEYSLDTKGLSIIDLTGSEYNILNWLAVLAQHRTYWQKGSIAAEAKKYLADNFVVDLKGCDVIIGYRADDSYFTFVQDFVSGTISLRKLSEAMHLGQLGKQIVLKSDGAFERLIYQRSIRADAEIYYQKKYERDLKARRDYRDSRSGPDGINDLFMIDIMRGEIKNGDPRLQ